MYIYLNNATYSYRRVIPKELKPYLNMTEFKRALVPDLESAKMIANKYNLLFSKLIVAIRLELNIDKLLQALGINSGPMGLESEPLPVVKTIHKPTPKKPCIFKTFLKTKEDIAPSSYKEYEQQLALLQHILPKDLQNMSYELLDTIKQTISNLPKRNIQKYRNMSLNQLIKSKVDDDDKISIKSQNEYLKTLRALFKFAHEREYMSKLIVFQLFKNKVSARNQREALNQQEIQLLFNEPKMADMARILYYSGMRLSEVYKCSIVVHDGVKCFDLTDRTIPLKTESSHRLIPVHKSMVDDVEDMITAAKTIQDKSYTRIASKLLIGKTKTLYSLRHSFATDLASSVDMSIVSELMGHAHKDMTGSRYVKGISIDVLQKAINNLMGESPQH